MRWARYIVTTYARDSIWNADRKPFKPLAGVERVGTNSIIISGETFTWTQANLGNVVRLLRSQVQSFLQKRSRFLHLLLSLGPSSGNRHRPVEQERLGGGRQINQRLAFGDMSSHGATA